MGIRRRAVFLALLSRALRLLQIVFELFEPLTKSHVLDLRDIQMRLHLCHFSSESRDLFLQGFFSPRLVPGEALPLLHHRGQLRHQLLDFAVLGSIGAEVVTGRGTPTFSLVRFATKIHGARAARRECGQRPSVDSHLRARTVFLRAVPVRAGAAIRAVLPPPQPSEPCTEVIDGDPFFGGRTAHGSLKRGRRLRGMCRRLAERRIVKGHLVHSIHIFHILCILGQRQSRHEDDRLWVIFAGRAHRDTDEDSDLRGLRRQ
mmetsp:Transcript_47138/g.131552  ORF Transcript_47138/g.131552 Transcript_47138/m.131552 type:complete len:260 (-) Transcript_47138:1853-2632(-)